MQLMISFVLLFSILSISFAANVSVHDYFDKRTGVISQLPWEFVYNLDHYTCIRFDILIINKPLSVTGYKVTYSTGQGFTDAWRAADKYFSIIVHSHPAELKVKLHLYRTTVLCSSLILAEGKTNWPGNKKPRSEYHQICQNLCILNVDISTECVDAPLDTDSKITTILKPVVKNKTSNNQTDYVPTSPSHDIIETTTIATTIEVTTNGTNATTIDNTITIISSIFGVVVVLLFIIAVGKWCWTRVTLRLPTIPPSEPFYLNMLFRRECNQQIEEIEQHQYEEIGEHPSEERENHYEEI